MPFSVIVLQHDAGADALARDVDRVFCDVLLLVAHCDGEFSDREALFAAIFSTLTLTPDYYAVRAAGFSADVASEGLAAVQARVLEAMSEVLARCPEAIRASLSEGLVESICTMAAADRVLHDAERALVVEHIAPRLGIEGSAAAAQLEAWGGAAHNGPASAKLLTELYVWMMDAESGAEPDADAEYAQIEAGFAAAGLPGPDVLGAIARAYASGARGFGELEEVAAKIQAWALESRSEDRAARAERLASDYQGLIPADQREVLGQWFFLVTLQDGLTDAQREALGGAFGVLGQDAEAMAAMAKTTLFDNPFFYNSVVGLGDQWAGVLP